MKRKFILLCLTILFCTKIFSLEPGDLTLPLKCRCRITLPFGTSINPFTQNEYMHNGCDFTAPTGTPVYAALDGYVSETGFDDSDGNYIVITHGDGVLTRYAHLNTIDCKNNDKVTIETQIGTLGNSGTVTGPCLCFQLEINKKKINPLLYVKDQTYITKEI